MFFTFFSITKIIFYFEALVFWVAETKFVSPGLCPVLEDLGIQGQDPPGFYLSILTFTEKL